MPKVRIRYLSDKIEKLRYIDGKSDWIDLRAAETIELKAGESCYIPFGIALRYLFELSYYETPSITTIPVSKKGRNGTATLFGICPFSCFCLCICSCLYFCSCLYLCFCNNFCPKT